MPSHKDANEERVTSLWYWIDQDVSLVTLLLLERELKQEQTLRPVGKMGSKELPEQLLSKVDVKSERRRRTFEKATFPAFAYGASVLMNFDSREAIHTVGLVLGIILATAGFEALVRSRWASVGFGSVLATLLLPLLPSLFSEALPIRTLFEWSTPAWFIAACLGLGVFAMWRTVAPSLDLAGLGSASDVTPYWRMGLVKRTVRQEMSEELAELRMDRGGRGLSVAEVFSEGMLWEWPAVDDPLRILRLIGVQFAVAVGTVGGLGLWASIGGAESIDSALLRVGFVVAATQSLALSAVVGRRLWVLAVAMSFLLGVGAALVPDGVEVRLPTWALVVAGIAGLVAATVTVRSSPSRRG